MTTATSALPPTPLYHPYAFTDRPQNSQQQHRRSTRQSTRRTRGVQAATKPKPAPANMDSTLPSPPSPQSPQPQSSRTSHTLMSLPPEIRTQIWTEVVAAHANKHHLADGYSRYKFHLALMRVSRQVHDEAREVFRRANVFVRVTTPWRQAEEHVAAEGRVPLLMTGSRAERFTDVHLSANIDVPDMSYPPGSNSTFLVAVDDMNAFCRMWFYSDLSHPGLNSHLRLALTLANPSPLPWSPSSHDLPRPLQRRLLDPFTLVKGLAHVSVAGSVDQSVKQDFLTRIAEPYATPESCLERCTSLKKDGDNLLANGDPRAALAAYANAFGAIHIVVAGRRRHVWGDSHFDTNLTSGLYAGKDGGTVRLQLRIRLVASIVEAHLALKEWDDARFWGLRTITLIRDALGPEADRPKHDIPVWSELGHIYYRTGLACREMGDEAQATELLDIAAGWLPDEDVQRLRRGVGGGVAKS